MREKIHPPYVDCLATCACGATFKTRSTKAAISLEICSQCHPFYTGREKMIDTAGRVEKFRRKMESVKPRRKKDDNKPAVLALAERAKEKDRKRAEQAAKTAKKQAARAAKEAAAEAQPAGQSEPPAPQQNG